MSDYPPYVIPNRHRGTYRRAMEGKSRKLAIRVYWLMYCGWQEAQVRRRHPDALCTRTETPKEPKTGPTSGLGGVKANQETAIGRNKSRCTRGIEIGAYGTPRALSSCSSEKA